ncbi:MAG TPA: RNA polymerase sigma factor, partial [Acidobacteriota bacterium]|nr:RNA polymerase sigma factor [Acidobacteriota bacterium]
SDSGGSIKPGVMMIKDATKEAIPDTVLAERVLTGDVNAFELLVHRYQSGLYRTARWMGLSHDVAEDMVQDTLLKAYERLGSCRDPERFGFWARRILRNTCLDYLKSAARRGAPLSLSLPADSVDPESEQERSTLRVVLGKALFTLPEEQREAFLMKHAEDLSYDEMAELTGSSVSALKMRVRRAREILRVKLNSFVMSAKM